MQNHLGLIADSLKQQNIKSPVIAVLAGGTSTSFINAMLSVLSPIATELRVRVHEALDENIRDLKSLLNSSSGVTLSETIINVGDDSQALLHLFNQRKLNGLSPLADNQTLSANFRLFRTQACSAISFLQASQSAGISSRGDHILVLGLQGYAGLFRVAQNVALLRQYRFVLCQATRGVLFADDQHSEHVESSLRELGFTLKAKSVSTVFPFEDLLFERDDDAISRSEARDSLLLEKAERVALQAALDAERKANEALRQTIEALEAKTSTVDVDHHATLQNAVGQLESENANLKALLYELTTKIERTEGQLQMIRELYLEERSGRKILGQ